MDRCCPNAVKESRSERVGLYRDAQWGVCLPGTSEDINESSSVSSVTSSERRLLRGDKTDKQRKNTINAMQQYDA